MMTFIGATLGDWTLVKLVVNTSNQDTCHFQQTDPFSTFTVVYLIPDTVLLQCTYKRSLVHVFEP